MFIKKLFNVLIPILGVLLIQSCIPDRMPTEPTENTRPKFVKFEFSGNSNLAIPLNQQIKMYFNEKMDLSTFPSNVTVESIDGKINGKFSYAAKSDTVVIFTPNTEYYKAEIYTVKVHGAVRDINHNSMISPNDDDVPDTTWFFTEGDYSLNGFPYIFVRDKAKKQIIYRSGNLNKYIDTLFVNATTEDYQTAALEFSPRGNYLWMVNLKTSDGSVTLIDPETFSVQSVIPVGLGPTNVGFNDNYAYVCNTSGKSFSVIDLGSYSVTDTYAFADGFKPKDVVYGNASDKLYFLSSNKKQIKIVNANDYNDNVTVDTLLVDNKGIDIEISEDGQYVFIPEKRTDKIAVYDAVNETPSNIIETGYPNVGDGVVSGDYYYSSFYKYTGGENDGGVLKINSSTQSIENVFTFPYEIDQLSATSGGELLYAVTAADSSLHIIETKTLQEISSVKISGSLKYVAVSKKNYLK